MIKMKPVLETEGTDLQALPVPSGWPSKSQKKPLLSQISTQ